MAVDLAFDCADGPASLLLALGVDLALAGGADAGLAASGCLGIGNCMGAGNGGADDDDAAADDVGAVALVVPLLEVRPRFLGGATAEAWPSNTLSGCMLGGGAGGICASMTASVGVSAASG